VLYTDTSHTTAVDTLALDTTQDTRSGAETAQVQDVMDGDIDLFVESYLRFKTKAASDAQQ
jgi:protein subunit release factor B